MRRRRPTPAMRTWLALAPDAAADSCHAGPRASRPSSSSSDMVVACHNLPAFARSLARGRKIALVTGGGTGIGLAIAKRFVREGAYVFIVGRRQRALDEAVALIGENEAGVQGDVTQAADIDRVFDSVRAAKGKLDTLVVDAGIAEPSP